MCGDLCTCFGFHRECFGAQHPFTQAVAQPVHQLVIRAHALLHDLRRDADHVRVANLAALHHFNDGHARAQFAGLRRHAHHTDIRGFQSIQHGRGCDAHGPWTKIFQQQSGVKRAPVVQRGGDTGSNGAAGFIGNQRHVLARTHSETRFHGVSRAGHQVRLWRTKVHLSNST